MSAPARSARQRRPALSPFGRAVLAQRDALLATLAEDPRVALMRRPDVRVTRSAGMPDDPHDLVETPWGAFRHASALRAAGLALAAMPAPAGGAE